MPDTDETVAPAHTTSPELREPDYGDAPPVDTSEVESLDQAHAQAAYNRAVMGPAASDPTIPTPGTEVPPEPGPGPEDNEALDNATGGAMSAAAESGTAWPEPPTADQFATKEVAAANIGIKTGEEGEVDESEEGEFDPNDHTVSEVQDYLDAHPEDEQRVLAAEADGKNRSSIVG